MADLLDSVEVGKAGDVAPRGSGVGRWFIPVTLASIADGDILTGFTPGFAGKILSIESFVTVVASTGGKGSTLNLEIDDVDVTGGALALTTSGCDTLGKRTAGSAITGTNEFGKGDAIDIEASSTTAFIEGEIVVVIAYAVLAV